ncbi:xylosyltransferase oxt [Teleopsis dalmanni]|uniref:xylosyltransferase oxt n=1 Tax=Teleopsis dalmanni TaxID=139649 RepID=UPI0018CDE5A5|nr:xylosyltransferase oxt [Teleopsis dalmanni]XP_037931350.1 xylosyltransferase oxt [Teleopsis dalmanni]
MSDNLVWRWMLRYKLFFFIGVIILGVQVYLAYKSLGIDGTGYIEKVFKSKAQTNERVYRIISNQNSDTNKDNKLNYGQKQQQNLSPTKPTHNIFVETDTNFIPKCEILAKEAISALQRAKTQKCRQQIADIACNIQNGEFYPKQLPNYCPSGNHTANTAIGCYRDEKEVRLLPDYFINLKTSNSPTHCVQICVQSGFPYAGVQYGSECFCGVEAPPTGAKLADSSCNMKCTGDSKDICGGYFSMNVYETGIAKFTPKVAETSAKPDIGQVKIAFLLTLNGRALRQVHRLIKALYSPNHIYYIHVDVRQDYLYRNLLELEKKFPNIRLTRTRFSTIWGGASLLSMLLQCMKDLLALNLQWDFVINLSESDFPVKTIDKLVNFLTANKGRNFVKSHGRETQRFIQKQGLDKTFVECETHMWRIGDRQLPAGIQVDGGSDWVALSRKFVHYVVTQAETDELLKGLLIIFRRTLLPAESFFHTVLRNSQFCDTYIDNNLHVTNWKRKLGCKCQYKHVVDWCGCSPNDFKLTDWGRLQGTEHKMLFFARKFEPIVSQAIILQLEEWLFGPYTSEFVNLHSYWQNFFSSEDKPTSSDNLLLTIGESLIRLLSRQLQLSTGKLLELNHYMDQEQYNGFLLQWQVSHENYSALTFESRIRPVQYVKFAKNLKFARRIRNFEVSSDFDQKEQLSRNFAKFLGPYSEPVLSFTVLGTGGQTHNDVAHSYNLTLLWIDPTGQLQDFEEIHIEDPKTDAIHFSKALVKQPLTPGVWTIKLVGRSAIYAETKFLISPLALEGGKPITEQRAKNINAGSEPSLPADFILPTEWKSFILSTMDVKNFQKLSKTNALRTGVDLYNWIDELVSKFYNIQEMCIVSEATIFSDLQLCRESSWSSLAPDPKSDINVLLKRR